MRCFARFYMTAQGVIVSEWVGRFRLDVRKTWESYNEGARHWNKMPEEVVDASSLEVFQVWVVWSFEQSHLLKDVSAYCRGLEWDDLFRSLTTQTILWFYGLIHQPVKLIILEISHPNLSQLIPLNT